jgi:hypothetical protein
MKLFIIIFCASLSVNALAQNVDTAKKDVKLADTTSAYIVDGKLVQSISDIKSTDIYGVSLLESKDAVKLYGPQAKNGAMVITTKPMAIKKYQEKLAAFSKKYQNYLALKGNDNNLVYVINNTMLLVGTKKTIRALFDLAPEDIQSVEFKKDSHFTNDATIIITTKDYNN